MNEHPALFLADPALELSIRFVWQESPRGHRLTVQHHGRLPSPIDLPDGPFDAILTPRGIVRVVVNPKKRLDRLLLVDLDCVRWERRTVEKPLPRYQQARDTLDWIRLAPDGSRLFVAGSVVPCEPPPGADALVLSLELPGSPLSTAAAPAVTLPEMTWNCYRAEFSPDARQVVVLPFKWCDRLTDRSQGGVFDASTGALLTTLSCEGRPLGARWSPCGRWLALLTEPAGWVIRLSVLCTSTCTPIGGHADVRDPAQDSPFADSVHFSSVSPDRSSLADGCVDGDTLAYQLLEQNTVAFLSVSGGRPSAGPLPVRARRSFDGRPQDNPFGRRLLVARPDGSVEPIEVPS